MALIKARLLDKALTSHQNFSSDRGSLENLTLLSLKPLNVCRKTKAS